MENTTEVGDLGEQLAAQYLSKAGYNILELKWRYGRNEVDLIVRKNNIICFVEVKLRTNTWAGEPFTFVTRKKQEAVVRAADRYMSYKVADDVEARFDVISIVHNNDYSNIEHIENAFYPML